ncbi:hypothetical protein [Bhargavaea cecembensis]|uniref:hypothetical protein n=1 Tax=Bhargavaea cecembensis TaxID=394098 RepID=UPI00058AC5DE|nr:hypothetical protein [Bhargavaea cecembensis]
MSQCSCSCNPLISLYFLAILAGFALLGLVFLLPAVLLLTGVLGTLAILVVLVIALFALAIIFKALHRLFCSIRS